MSEHGGHQQPEIEEDIGGVVVHDFSNPPDCILEHILSFMPTKEAVKTSVLSTRWKNLWASIPNIDIDDELLDSEEVDDVNVTYSFVKFVERVLRLQDASILKKFRLSCHAQTCYNVPQIHSWISYAIMHNVQELDLYLATADPSVIPQSLFDSSTSLVTLKLETPCFVELPSHVSFPCLKTLHLSHVQIPNDDFTNKLFSGCPVLENFVLSDCMWMHLEYIVIYSSTLKSLTIDDHSFPLGCRQNRQR